tara:strand:- start:869 stop:1258 length:390 start_codon:yes stop_codon:yes gene_type:complete
MNDEDLNLYAEKLVLTSTTDTHIDGLANTFTNTTPSDSSGYIVTGGNLGMGTTAPNTKLHANGNNTYYTQVGMDQTLLSKEQQLEDVKDILNSVQRALEGLKTQVQVLSASIEDENELKHKRRKLGGNE